MSLSRYSGGTRLIGGFYPRDGEDSRGAAN
jgi:hypothetical protein